MKTRKVLISRTLSMRTIISSKDHVRTLKEGIKTAFGNVKIMMKLCPIIHVDVKHV